MCLAVRSRLVLKIEYHIRLPGGNNAASLILSCDPDCSSLSLFEPFLKSWGSGGLICRAQQDSTLPR